MGIPTLWAGGKKSNRVEGKGVSDLRKKK